MSGPTKIEWADAVWNPVTGCSKVSAGCAHCYAERMATRLAGRAGYPKENPFAVTLHPGRLDEPLHWRKPRRIFVCSMSDLFHPNVPDEFIKKVWNRMACAAWHTYQVLTKRPERMVSLLRGFLPLPHVWLGTSVEDQPTADNRIPHLLRCPAAVRFVSYEPALGPVGLHSLALSGAKPSGFIDALGNQSGEFSFQSHRIGDLPSLDWVIAGGESGPKARPAHPDWFRSVRDQCQAAGVAFFFKQWGEWAPTWPEGEGESPPSSLVCRAGHRGPYDPTWLRTHRELCPADDLVVYRTGKKAAGRLLDGREWNEYPACQG